jgi:DUF917 family protein
MGAGGGGRPTKGLKLLLDQLEAGREIKWGDVGSLPDEAWTVTVAGMGGRGGRGGTEEELAALGCVEERYDSLGLMVAAVRALEDAAGVKVGAIVPGEIGAGNVPAPIAAAMELGLPVVDGDYAGGRAIPELPQTIPEVLGMPVCPLSFVTRWGDTLILKDTISTAMADRIGRMLCVAAYGGVGISWYLMQIKDVKEMLACGTLTEALHIGQAIREAREKGADPVAEAVKAVSGWLLFEGELTSTEIADEQSYAFGLGSHTLKGLGSHEGHTLKIWYKNEYHVTWRDDQPYVTSPDSLIMVDLKTGEPATSYDFAVGDQVAVVGRKAHPVHRLDKGVELLGPRHFGFDLDYVPIEEVVESFDL